MIFSKKEEDLKKLGALKSLLNHISEGARALNNEYAKIGGYFGIVLNRSE